MNLQPINLMDTTNNTIGNVFSNIRKATALFVLVILSTGSLLAQRAGGTGTVHGRILDAGTGNFMENAEITIDGTGLVTSSAQGGFYVLNGVRAGEATVVVSYAGYVTERKTVVVAGGGQVAADFEMRLTPSSLDAPSVSAAAPGEKKDDVVLLDKLTVTTERAGNARAFMAQKNSMTMSTVLATDSFGTVPNGNIAEFLRNMPGLSALEDDVTGEADQISIGGMDPSLTGVYLDGARMASGAKGGFDEDARSFRFDQVSINGIESIEVRRTVSADMEGDAPAGGISMRTKSAFDSKTARFRYDVYLTGNSYNMDFDRTPGADDGKSIKFQPAFSFTYSTPFRRGTMGLLVQAGYQQDFRESNRVDATPQGDLLMLDPYLNNVTFRNTQVQSTRMDASIRWDWKISPFAKASVQFSHNYRDTTSFNRNAVFATGRNTSSDISSLLMLSAPENETATQNRIEQSASYSDSNTENANITFNWKRYGFTLDAIATWSYAVGKKNPTNGEWFSRSNMYRARTSASSDWSLWGSRGSTRTMDWSFYRGARSTMTPDENLTGEIGDIGRYTQNGAYSLEQEIRSNSKETIPTVKVDLRWDAPTPFPLWFKAGVNWRQNKRNAWQPVDSTGAALRNRFQYIGPVGVKDPSRRGGTGANYDYGNVRDESSTLYDPNVPLLSSDYFLSEYQFNPHFGGNIADLHIPVLNMTRLYSVYKDHFAIDEETDAEGYVRKVQNPNNWFWQNPNDVWNQTIENWTARRNLSENIWAGYLMGEVRPWKNWVFQAGARFEYTSQEAVTLIPMSTGRVERILGTKDHYRPDFLQMLYKNGERTTTTNDYSFLLPSAAAKYNFTPNFTAHLAYSEGFGRVSVDKLANNWKVSEGATNVARAPNPSLEPDRYKTYSAAVEYYFEPAGTFTFTYSYRQWTGTTYQELLIEGANVNDPPPALKTLIALYGVETIQGFLDNDYLIYTWQPSNINDRAMQTLEFSYRQRIPAIPGLQIDANFTRIIPNWRKEGASSAPKLATGGISYSNRNLFVRISGNWRSRYWNNWPEEAANVDYKQRIGVNARFLLNTEVVYRFTPWLSFYARADNLLNSSQTQYRNSADIISQETLSGIALRVGFKGDF